MSVADLGGFGTLYERLPYDVLGRTFAGVFQKPRVLIYPAEHYSLRYPEILRVSSARPFHELGPYGQGGP